ncbi:MAG: STAS domain-containing protein [Rhodocyclaceae bacterium]|nr:STAS domain-containing protein [Rhodocyclaceae bacterium]
MIRAAGDRVQVSGPMTLDGATGLLADGAAALSTPATVFDLAEVTNVDSSSLAVVFGWVRAGRDRGAEVRVANVPRDLLSLAEVYGVSELLPVSG